MDRQPDSASDFTWKPPAASRGSCSPAPDHASVAAPRTSESPMEYPARFFGESAEWSGFLSSISRYIGTQLSHFPTKRAKIAFFIALLSGDALSWASKMWSVNGGDFGLYVNFIVQFMGMFGMTMVDLHYSPHGFGKAPDQMADVRRCQPKPQSPSPTEYTAQLLRSTGGIAQSLGLPLTLPPAHERDVIPPPGSEGDFVPSPGSEVDVVPPPDCERDVVPPPGCEKEVIPLLGREGDITSDNQRSISLALM